MSSPVERVLNIAGSESNQNMLIKNTNTLRPKFLSLAGQTAPKSPELKTGTITAVTANIVIMMVRIKAAQYQNSLSLIVAIGVSVVMMVS